jgi:hypothetical protein
MIKMFQKKSVKLSIIGFIVLLIIGIAFLTNEKMNKQTNAETIVSENSTLEAARKRDAETIANKFISELYLLDSKTSNDIIKENSPENIYMVHDKFKKYMTADAVTSLLVNRTYFREIVASGEKGFSSKLDNLELEQRFYDKVEKK